MYRLTATGNPLLQLAGLAVGAVVAVGAILLGAVVLAFLLGFALVAGLVIYIRLWWLRRMRGWSGPRAHGSRGPSGQARGKGPAQGSTRQSEARKDARDIVEVEYTVIEERPVRGRKRD